jgi:hypothetical protein
MRQGKFKFLLVALLVVAGLLFAGGEARANFTNFCYQVNFTADTGTSPASRSYAYHFSPVAGCTSNTSVKNVLYEIPVDVPIDTNPPSVTYQTGTAAALPLACTVLAPGVGDPDTRLGVGDIRYRVLRCNAPSSGGFPRDYRIYMSLTNINIANKKLGEAPQVVQLKAGNSLSDSDVIPVPALMAVPLPPPAPTVSFFNAIPSAVEEGQCITLTWSSTGATSGTINPGNASVAPSGNLQLCPAATTTYTLSLTGPGGSTEQTVTATVNPPTAPSIEIARETIEKKDANGLVVGYVTFYFMNGAPACSCVTQTNDQILAFPCQNDPLPANCNPAKDSDTNPVLVCLPFPGWSEADLLATCGGRPNCGVLEATCKDGAGNPFPCLTKCDILEAITNDTTMQIGQNTCCAKTSQCRTLSGRYVTCTTYVPCSATETCP